eukprot:scaffold18774_cov220-Cylindrotheca_fusiformis.AAC.2
MGYLSPNFWVLDPDSGEGSLPGWLWSSRRVISGELRESGHDWVPPISDVVDCAGTTTSGRGQTAVGEGVDWEGPSDYFPLDLLESHVPVPREDDWIIWELMFETGNLLGQSCQYRVPARPMGHSAPKIRAKIQLGEGVPTGLLANRSDMTSASPRVEALRAPALVKHRYWGNRRCQSVARRRVSWRPNTSQRSCSRKTLSSVRLCATPLIL